MIYVFDLDDTLYDEMSYVRSGFMAVARKLEVELGLKWETAYREMIEVLEKEGRGQVFNRVLSSYGLMDKNSVRKCLMTYREHNPEISLLSDANRCLQRIGDGKFYIVTDGNKSVQYRKIRALGLEERARKVYITHRYGIRHSKPSPYCFLKIANNEGVSPKDIVYIGDNPNKDFVGIKPLGFRTIRIMRGSYQQFRLDEAYEADQIISSLDEIT